MAEESIFSFDTDKTVELIISYGASILGSVTVLIIGFWLSKITSRYIYALMLKNSVDPATRNFLQSLLAITLNVIVVLIAVNTMGVQITSVLAVLGGAALGLGMGLQGGLANFAAGVMIILTKPFKTGDLIESGTHIGYVEKISLLNTTIRSPRNEVIILPNSPLFNTSLSNFSVKKNYRIDITVGIEYKSDIKKLKTLLQKAIKEEVMFLSNRPIVIEIEDFAEDRVNLTVRAFTLPKQYFNAPLRLREIVNDTIEANGFTIPIAQRHIKIINETT